MPFKGAAVAALSLLLSSMALGQAVTRADPADPQSAAAPVRYESVFQGYRMFTDEKVVSWRATNDLVQKLGGWQAFARDKVPDIPPVTAPSEEPASKAPSPSSQPPKASAPGHPGHK